MAEIKEELHRDNLVEVTLELNTERDRKFFYRKALFEVPNIGEEKLRVKSAYLTLAFSFKGEIKEVKVKRTGEKEVKIYIIFFLKGGLNMSKIIAQTRNRLRVEYTGGKTNYFKEFTVALSSEEIKRQSLQIFDLLKKLNIEINELDENIDFEKIVLYLPILAKDESPQIFWFEEENDKLNDKEILGYISYKISEDKNLKKFHIKVSIKVMVIQRMNENAIRVLFGGKKIYL